MTQELHNLILKRENLLRKIRDQPYNQILNQKYLNLKNLTANSIKIAKQRFFQDKFETAKSDPNKKWEFVNTVLNRNSSKENAPSYLSLDGEKITSHQEMTEKFNQFFTTVGTNLAAALPPSDIDPLSYLEKSNHHEIFKFWEISEDQTSKLLQISSAKKAVGCDSIPMKLLKENSHTFSPILTFMINLIIKTSYFPDCQKIARVRPLHKKGDKSELNNYRPISILTAVSKIIEKVLASQLRSFLESYEMFSTCQFGFREKKSTTSSISKLMEQLCVNFDESMAFSWILAKHLIP